MSYAQYDVYGTISYMILESWGFIDQMVYNP